MTITFLLKVPRLTKSASVKSDVPLDSDPPKDVAASQSRMNIGAQRIMMPQRVATSDPVKVERTALRVQKTTNLQSSAEAEPILIKNDKDKSLDVTQTSGAIHSFGETKNLINDPLWSNRFVINRYFVI